MNMHFDFNNPTRILFGSGKLNELGNQPMPGKKALLLVKGAGHARSIVCARAEYTRTLYAFLDEFAGGPA